MCPNTFETNLHWFDIAIQIRFTRLKYWLVCGVNVYTLYLCDTVYGRIWISTEEGDNWMFNRHIIHFASIFYSTFLWVFCLFEDFELLKWFEGCWRWKSKFDLPKNQSLSNIKHICQMLYISTDRSLELWHFIEREAAGRNRAALRKSNAFLMLVWQDQMVW